MPRSHVSLRDYVDALRATDQDALRVAKAEVDRHLHALNDLHARMERERSDFLTVKEYEQRHDTLLTEIAKLHEARVAADAIAHARDQARGRLIAMIAVLGSFLGAIAVIVAHIAGA